MIKLRYLILFITLVIPLSLALGQNMYKVSGQVFETGDKKTLGIIGASVSIKGDQRGVVTGENGKWTIDLRKGNYLLMAKHIGYHSDTIQLEVTEAVDQVNFYLLPNTLEINSVQIKAKARTWNLTKLDPGQTKLAAAELAQIPSLLGEKDPLNSLRSLPGIQSVGEGTGYFYIRGGAADQNLILMDGATLYHPSHLLGIFSVINPAVIESIDLYKGGMPANYGNRLASVIDIQTRDGDPKAWKGGLSVGLIASRIHLEGPIIKDKLSVLIAFRRTHLDLLYRIAMPKSSPFYGSGYSFSDANAKITWTINPKNTLRFSAYAGSDIFMLDDKELSLSDNIRWDNRSWSLSLHTEINSKLSSKASLTFSGFDFEFTQDYREYFVGINSGLENFNFKEELSWQVKKGLRLRAGLEMNNYRFNPYNVDFNFGETEIQFGDLLPYKARDIAGFADIRTEFLDRFILQAGLRFVHFEHRGPFQRFILDQYGFPLDSLLLPEKSTLASYNMLEPRMAFTYLLNEDQRLKMSLTRNYQPIHMVPISTSTLPLDLWLPSTTLLKPQSATAFSLGWFRDFQAKRIEASIEGFYRKMNNLVDFSEYQTIYGLSKNNMDQQMSIGQGNAIGIELFIRKNSGKIKGWLAYTLSRTMYQFPDINNSNPYPPRHDRLHDFNIFLSREISKKWDASIQFVYASGQPITLPISFYVLNGSIVQYFNERNSVRLPAYHRMDVAFSKKPSKKRKIQSSWTFSIYNLYNRINPLIVYFDLHWDYEKNLLMSQGRKVGLFPIIPSLTWSMEF